MVGTYTAEASVGGLIDWAVGVLAGASSTARLDAEVLMAFAAGTARSSVIAFPERALPAAQQRRFRALVARRREGAPVAQLLGRREFFSMTLDVTPDTLVPRPESELAVEHALAYLPQTASSRVLDLGTGTGALALAIKRARPHARVTGVDASGAALAVARGNARKLGLSVRWLASDWFEALAGERFELIVSNPPYVAEGDPHWLGALRFEPRMALDGGPDGLSAIRAIVAEAGRHLTGASVLLLENGYDQAASVKALLAAAGFEWVATHRDLGGRDRLTVARGGERR